MTWQLKLKFSPRRYQKTHRTRRAREGSGADHNKRKTQRDHCILLLRSRTTTMHNGTHWTVTKHLTLSEPAAPGLVFKGAPKSRRRRH